ncbi:amidophosphoribosyltransferase [Candidatus Kinetoplastidibacterium crithidiae]|uniref:Amidophosphoribosyltransferase n=1 Tax=Candidatus Kinetoplastidibacterium crithidiae TCC036E TaxID=1208918 RepID=M1LWK3_9PROT|nr:amidophosphoribosyltransferase [Candidatus Kinetoplastibacterium crithidii]AFZ82745.1 amidophosphoribosyltransferase [Candidatus Kinetoplastibacterium crithidii (ex Angomonas deanei ATCC 30255)]AGF47604.1 amidophosphoribosyltransferase [Candidatus Kinetoplastibacterium crithidii TCC036E]
MCGIVGVIGRSQVNQLIYDSLLLLQHRGQDAAGIATSNNGLFNLHKSHGLVRDVFRSHNMLSLPGCQGIGQVRYPTAGSNNSEHEAQPFYVNAPFGIMFAHNGNLTNWKELRESLFKVDQRHINTNSDSEVLLNIFAHELHSVSSGVSLDENAIFKAVENLHKRVRGAYAVVSLISGYGLVAFRDIYGIRPLCIGRQDTDKGVEWMIASESVALEGNGFKFVRDVAPGETIFIDLDGNFYSKVCSDKSVLTPCIFEYIYFARPDSFIDGVSVYDARLRMGEYLAAKISKEVRSGDIDVVIPIPDSSRPAAMQLAGCLNLDYREGLIKNRYVGRTFIMPGQSIRRKSVRQKLNTIATEFKNKNVLLVDDSIVRGTTSKEIVEMARSVGARKVYFASAAAPIRYQNVYGIDMPTPDELVASNRTEEEVRKFIGSDYLIYQNIEDMEQSVRGIQPSLANFEASCFNGVYITGDVNSEYLSNLSNTRTS